MYKLNSIIIVCAYILQVYFGTHHSRMYILATLANKNCANGMSWLVRKEALEQEGGIEAFREYLAEDFYMNQALLDRYVYRYMTVKKCYSDNSVLNCGFPP